MNDVHLLLLGVALGAAPSAELGRVLLAALAKRVGVKPGEITRYAEASDGDAQTSPDDA